MATGTESKLMTLRARAEAQARKLALPGSPGDARSSPVVLFVEELLLEAERAGAADLHIIPSETHCPAAFLIQGHLQPVCMLTPELYEMVRARLKIMAGLNLLENRRAQDGLLYQGLPAALAGWMLRLRTLPAGRPWELLVVALRRAPLPFKPPLSAA